MAEVTTTEEQIEYFKTELEECKTHHAKYKELLKHGLTYKLISEQAHFELIGINKYIRQQTRQVFMSGEDTTIKSYYKIQKYTCKLHKFYMSKLNCTCDKDFCEAISSHITAAMHLIETDPAFAAKSLKHIYRVVLLDKVFHINRLGIDKTKINKKDTTKE